MKMQFSERQANIVVVAVANLFNLFMVGIFFARIKGITHPQAFGLVWAVFILLLAASGYMNLRGNRGWWSYLIPLIMIIFLGVELVLDYLLQIDFRSTSLLAPYLILYYLAILGMIGYAFQAGRKWGFLTLGSYFLSQIAALLSYFQVGHGG